MMIKIVNPLISQEGDDLSQGSYRFTAGFKDEDKFNRDATVISKILNGMQGIDGEMIELKYDEPVTFTDNKHVTKTYGMESITCRNPDARSEGEYPNGHVEIVTTNPGALKELMLKTLGKELDNRERLDLERVFRGLGQSSGAVHSL